MSELEILHEERLSLSQTQCNNLMEEREKMLERERELQRRVSELEGSVAVRERSG